jgi:hypothetical protein
MNEDKQERDRAKLAAQVRELMEILPMRMDLERFNAKVTRAKFLALVGEGFTEEQALRLCRQVAA